MSAPCAADELIVFCRGPYISTLINRLYRRWSDDQCFISAQKPSISQTYHTSPASPAGFTIIGQLSFLQPELFFCLTWKLWKKCEQTWLRQGLGCRSNTASTVIWLFALSGVWGPDSIDRGKVEPSSCGVFISFPSPRSWLKRKELGYNLSWVEKELKYYSGLQYYAFGNKALTNGRM